MKVHVSLCPREQPFFQSYKSLMKVYEVTENAGIKTVESTVLNGTYGFRNTGIDLQTFLDHDCDYFFAAADDMLYPEDILIKMVEAQKELICATYFKRKLHELEPAAFCDDIQEFKTNLALGSVNITKYLSGHTMMVHRSVFEKMMDSYPELQYSHFGRKNWGFFMPMIDNGILLLDDWAFSTRAKRCGYLLWQHFGVVCQHHASDFIGRKKEEEKKECLPKT